MSDLFHKQVHEDVIRQVFGVMRQASWHTIQILTKRAERMADLSSLLPWPGNVWMGVSVETSAYLYRLDLLRQVPANLRFVSIEPLLEDLEPLDLSGINWVIAGGESGPNSRPMQQSWIINIRDRCLANQVPFFFKQWGGTNKKAAGCLLEGKVYKESPGKPFKMPLSS